MPQPSRSLLPLRVIRATACARLFLAPAGRAFSTAPSKSRASDGFPVRRRFATLAAIVTMPFRILSLLLCLLVSATRAGSSISIVYDGDGNRVSKTVDSTTTYYLVDDRNPTGYPQVLEERSALTGDPTVKYLYGLALVSQTRGTDTHYYGYDGLGSVRYLTDANGLVTDTYTYDAFGIQIASTGSTPNNYRYAGEQWDNDLSLYYLRARYLNPAIGRFWTMDTFEGTQSDPLSLHKYLYAHNNPVNGCDPSGHETLGNVLVTSSIIGGLAGGVVGGIRNGVEGAIVGVVSGAVLAPLATLATIGGGIGIASAAGISTTAGITTSFAIVTSGSLAWNTYELLHAKNDRERVAAGVSMLFTVGGAAYGAYRLSEVPMLPSKAPSGNALPASKEQVGALLSETMALRRGEVVVAREVTVDTASGVRVRVDLVTRSITGKLRLIDAKFGPGAKFTDNQKVGYPEIGNTGGKIVGGKLEGQGLPAGSKLEPMDVLVDWW